MNLPNYNFRFDFTNIDDEINIDSEEISKEEFEEKLLKLEICYDKYGIVFINHKPTETTRFCMSYGVDFEDESYCIINHSANRIYVLKKSGEILYKDFVSNIKIPNYFELIDNPPDIIKLIAFMLNCDLNKKPHGLHN